MLKQQRMAETNCRGSVSTVVVDISKKWCNVVIITAGRCLILGGIFLIPVQHCSVAMLCIESNVVTRFILNISSDYYVLGTFFPLFSYSSEFALHYDGVVTLYGRLRDYIGYRGGHKTQMRQLTFNSLGGDFSGSVTGMNNESDIKNEVRVEWQLLISSLTNLR